MSKKLSSTQERKLIALKNELHYFAANCLQIKTKDAKIVPLKFNQSQEYFHNRLEELKRSTGMVRVLVVKGRQSGISTYVAARFYHKTIFHKATNTFILSHESNTTAKLFEMVKTYHEKNPFKPATKKSNAKELDFNELKSNYFVGTAGSGDVGRGGTVHNLHGSEVAMWSNTDDIQTGLMESVPPISNTEIILESTAKGMGNFFHRLVTDALQGKNEYTVVFLPWFWMDEYEMEPKEGFTPSPEELEYADTFLSKYDDERILRKLAWRRNKINTLGREWKFKQEYPSTVQEAFQSSVDTLISSEGVAKARAAQSIVSNQAPLIIGVDPARTGDRTAIVFRRGREIERFITYDEMDEMRLAGIITNFIETYDPAAVNIDVTNSHGVHDRLVELGYGGICNGIHFSSKADDNTLYRNKRTEMWCNLAKFFDMEGICIPDDDEFATDLLSVPDYRETSDGLISLVSKDKIREESGLSPDIGDAAALTFAVKVRTRSFKPVRKANAGTKTSNRFTRKKQ